MNKNRSPYKAHLFICQKSRDKKRKSCGDINDPKLKDILKDEVKNRGWKPQVRISDSSCLGLCEFGPNIMIHPQQIWLSDVSRDDIPDILKIIEDIICGDSE
ncbi:MAG TPA: (2Fe-2S) ferredoxin domain-containing protein [Pontiella sp.]